MSNTTVLLLIFFLMSAGFLGIGIQMNRWLARPRTLNDDYCSAVDVAIDRQLAEQQEAGRQKVLARMAAALDEERRAIEADLQWAAVEADWHAFVDQWPTLDEAR